MKRRYAYQQNFTVDASGDAVVYFGKRISGRVIAIKYEPGSSGIDTNGDLTLTGEDSGVPILTKANAGTSTVWFYPRALANKNTDGAAATDFLVDIFVFSERIKLVVAQGGNATSGSMTIYTEEEG